jgi:parvulin-like peptidyl-prolyl isomerase
MSRRILLWVQIVLLGLLSGSVRAGFAQQSKPSSATTAPDAAANGATPADVAPAKPSASGISAKPSDRVVLSVGDDKMTVQDVGNILNALSPQARAYYGGPGKKDLPQYLIELKILDAEAKKQHLEDQPEVREALEIARESILADAARKRIVKSIPVSEANLKEVYEKRKAEFDEVRIRHMLIRTETSILNQYMPANKPPPSSQEARKKLEKLRAEILKGADFAQMAQTNSDDLRTAGNGGDMGYITRQSAVPPIAEAAYSLRPGQVSEIIPTPYGLEVIKVEDRRFKPFEEVKAVLEEDYRKSKYRDALSEVSKNYKIDLDIAYFGAKFQVEGKNFGTPQAPK